MVENEMMGQFVDDDRVDDREGIRDELRLQSDRMRLFRIDAIAGFHFPNP